MDKMKHPLYMDVDELREIVSAMSCLALDLAQHLDFTLYALKREYVPHALERALAMAYDLSNYAYEDRRFNPHSKIQTAIFGQEGLTVERIDEMGNLHLNPRPGHPLADEDEVP